MGFGRLSEAIRIAAVAHAGQMDKAGQPYILHVLRVGAAGHGLTEQIVGFLHDVLEDTDFPVNALRAVFDNDIIEALSAITRSPGEGYRFYIERVAKNPIARAVKINDLKDNLGRLHGSRFVGGMTEETEGLRRRYRAALAQLGVEEI